MAPTSADVDALLRSARRQRAWQPGPATRGVDLRGAALEELLHHRPPFLLIDAITAFDSEQAAIEGRAWIDPANPVLRGHFPDRPVYPGALLMEMIAEVMGCYHPLTTGHRAEMAFATACRGFFLRPVLPGDEIVILARRIGEHDGLVTRAVGQILRGGDVCAGTYIEACHVGP